MGNTGTLDVSRILAAVSQFALGLVITLAARGVWAEAGFVNFRGIDEWYGKVAFASGLVLMAAAVVDGLLQLPNFYRTSAHICSLVSATSSLAIASIVGIRVNQIAADISNRARSPEKWFEGTILEGFGRILANAADSISESVQPSLTAAWRWLLIGSVLGVLLALAQIWQIVIRTRKQKTSSQDSL
jgi:hypothetical protein